jgi:hypothetical protein
MDFYKYGSPSIICSINDRYLDLVPDDPSLPFYFTEVCREILTDFFSERRGVGNFYRLDPSLLEDPQVLANGFRPSHPDRSGG